MTPPTSPPTFAAELASLSDLAGERAPVVGCGAEDTTFVRLEDRAEANAAGSEMLGEDVVVELGAVEGAAEAFGLTLVSSPLTIQTPCAPL